MNNQDTKPFLSIPNWDEMQHYKDRSPPWIKLQNELLENYEFECLHDASKAHLLCIWLLASRTGNKINPDPRWIGRKIGANSKVDVDGLVKSGFLQLNQPLPSMEHDASKVLQTAEQDAIPEGEGEGEGEQSREREEGEALPSKLDDVDLVFDYWVFAMGKGSRAKKTQGRIKKIQARLAEGYSVELIKRAIDGCKLSPHHMGQNDQNKVYDDIDLICRSGEKLEGFIENVSRPPVPKGVSAKEQQRADKIQARNEVLGIQLLGNQPFIDGDAL